MAGTRTETQKCKPAYFTFFQAFVVLGGFALACISFFNVPADSLLNSCTLQVLFVQNYISLAVGIVLVVISILYGYIGNTLFIQSSTKFNHDVEEMRKTILSATACISGTTMVAGGFFLVSFAMRNNLVEMTDNMFMFGDTVLAIYYSCYAFFGYIAL